MRSSDDATSGYGASLFEEAAKSSVTSAQAALTQANFNGKTHEIGARGLTAAR
jgi:hypothetical protein